MDVLTRDLRYALRSLARNPGFAAVAIAVLALGIGANTAIFSLVRAVLLRPLPFADAERLMVIWEDVSYLGFPRNTPAPANYLDWKTQSEAFEDMAATDGRSYNLTGDGEPEKLAARGVSYNLFSMLGVGAQVGRIFREDEDRADAPKVALVSYRLWRRRFGGDPGLVGRDIQLSGVKHTVVGVMPSWFTFPDNRIDLWVPIAFTPQQRANRGSHYLRVFGRLKRGVEIESARSEMATIAERLAREYPRTNTNVGAIVVPLREEMVGEVRLGLIVLLGAVACVLLITCANVGNLLLARSAARQREIAVRAALGAGRGRILRQLLTESLLLAGCGAILGLGLALASFEFLVRLVPDSISGMARVRLDPQVLAFTLVVALATGAVFGLAPALHVARVDLAETLRQAGSRSDVAGGRRLRGALVVAEVALALVLLVGAALLVQSFARLRGLDPGFDASNVLTLKTDLPRSKYAETDRRVAFYDAVLERVAALPGVESAGFATWLPLTQKGGTSSFSVEGQPPPSDDNPRDANLRAVTPGYLETLKIPLRRGRFLAPSDGSGSQLVSVINETMARKYWPGEDAVGRRFKFGDYDSDSPWITVVGIVGDVRQMGLEIPGRAEMYLPARQSEQFWVAPRDLAIRTRRDPTALASAVRRIIAGIDPDQPVADVQTLDDILDREVSQRRLQTALLAAFSGLALLLAALGIYGVLAYSVTQRTTEIGLRVALGARPADVVRMVVAQGAGLVLLGIAIGLAVSFALARLVSKLLYGIEATDATTFAAAPIVLAAVALAASYLPARRAARVDPMIALRHE